MREEKHQKEEVSKLLPHEVVRKRGMGKAYSNHQMNTVEYRNFAQGREWSFKACGGSRGDIEKSFRLTGDNRENFNRLFGKCSFVFNGSHYFRCWYIRLKTLDMLILTAREHGTCYEIVMPENKYKTGYAHGKVDISEALRFMESLMKVLPDRKSK